MQSQEKTAEEKYADIIHLNRPEDEAVFRKHPRMLLAERAKIFAPFAALRGHSDRLALEDGKLKRQRKLELSEGESQILSDKLAQVEKHMVLSVIYFIPDAPGSEMGCYSRITGPVTSFDPVLQTMRIKDTDISFENLADLCGEDITDPSEHFCDN